MAKKAKTLREHITELVALKLEDRPELEDRAEEIVEEAINRVMRVPTSRRERMCPVTRDEFVRLAEPLVVDIGGHEVTAMVTEFQTGSLGWKFSDRTLQIDVGGMSCIARIDGRVIIVQSRNAPRR